jgi:hypothetical protein
MLPGTAPVPVSSGRTDRHRLNRLGDRQLNRALHVIAVSRMRHHPPTLAYVKRRRAQSGAERKQDGHDDEVEEAGAGQQFDADNRTGGDAGQRPGDEDQNERAPGLALPPVSGDGTRRRHDVEQQIRRGDHRAGRPQHADLEREQQRRLRAAVPRARPSAPHRWQNASSPATTRHSSTVRLAVTCWRTTTSLSSSRRQNVVRSGGQKVASRTSRSSEQVGAGPPSSGGRDAYSPTDAPPDAVTPLHLRSDEPRAQIRVRGTLSCAGARTTTYQTSPSRWLWPESRRAMRSCAVSRMSACGWCAYSASSTYMS